MSGIRSKQLDLEELYGVLDSRFMGKMEAITVTITESNWTKENDQYLQIIEDKSLENVNSDTKLVVKVKILDEDTYDEVLEKENLFAHITKIIPSEKSLKIYSYKNLETSFDIQISFFN